MNYFEPYKVIRDISQGGMAKILLVEHKGSFFALKVSKVSGRSPELDLLNNKAIRKEADLLSRIKHQRIVKIYPIPTASHVRKKEVFCAKVPSLNPSPCFFIMEYLEGGTLDLYIKNFGPLSVKETANIIGNIFLGLHYLQKLGIAHNDVSPRNIVFRTKIIQNQPFDPVLVDLGAAAGIKNFRDEAGALFIMSPERIRIARGLEAPETIKRIDPSKIDVWSLGVILYYALTKNFPFSSTKKNKLTSEILTQAPKSIRKFNRNVPPLLANFIIDDCLCKEPSGRPSLLELGEFLKPYGWGRIVATHGATE